jgi:hypothetical protein
MALGGKGMLVVFTDVKSRDERDLNDWYNREHIDERVGMPGFRRARRYVSVGGTPRYLATYECASVADLAAPAYLAVLANQTPWSQAVMARFTHFTRLTLRIQLDLTHGVGGAVTTVRFVPHTARKHALLKWLRDTVLPRAIKRPDMLGAAAGENDLDVANAPIQEKSMDRLRAEDIEWLVMLEGADARATAAVARQAFTRATLKRFGVTEAPIIGTYRFAFGNQR